MSVREVMSEQLSLVCEGAGYDDVYPSGVSLRKMALSPIERELFAHSSTEEEEEDEENEEGEEDEENDDGRENEYDESDEEVEGERGDEEDQFVGVEAVGQVGGGARPFILPLIWMVNDFYLVMSDKVFNTLCDCYQIPENIPLRLPRKFERCYSRRTADVGMYDAMFTARLRLPLTELHRQLANYLGLSVSQIAPNAWRIFIGAEVIWGQLSGGNLRLFLDEFFYFYKLQKISSLKGIYHFLARKTSLMLVSDMPNSNRNWKNCYFFVQGTNWVCRLEEWDSMPNGFHNT